MTIIAKYSGICTKCGSKINPGEKINWEKNQGASHVTCPAKIEIPKTLSRIEYITGYGSFGACWADCGERTEEFIKQAAEFNHVPIAAIHTQLLNGNEVIFDQQPELLIYKIRDAKIAGAKLQLAQQKHDAKQAQFRATHKFYRCKSCGQTGYSGDYPFSTAPDTGYCDDCG